MDLDDIAEELYRVPPASFTTARAERAAEAAAAGDRALAAAVRKLRKPSAAAWALNLLARSGAAELDELFRLGAELRTAQRHLAGAQIRSLSARRHGLVGELAEAARRLAAQAGHSLSDAAVDDVVGTLEVAVADSAVADDVRAGRVTTPVTPRGILPGGLPEEDPAMAGGAPGPGGGLASSGSLRAAAELAAARSALEDAERARTEADARVVNVRGEVADAEASLEALRAQERAALAGAVAAQRALRRAERQVAAAGAAVARAEG